MEQIELLGVLGGLGPASSAYCYELITGHTKAARNLRADGMHMHLREPRQMPHGRRGLRCPVVATGLAEQAGAHHQVHGGRP